MNKAENIPRFSQVVGYVDNHDWPPTVRLHETGNIIASCLSKIKTTFPFTSILRRCIMPDHVHIDLFVKEATETHLGQIIAAFKRHCSTELEKLGYPPQTDLFIENYHDTFLRGKGQLKALLKYISDNPRRYLIRTMHKGWFRRFVISDGKDRYEAYGNWDLLSEFQRVQVKFSSKYTPSELKSYKRLWYRTILNDGIIVSPFIHAEEKKVRNWAMENGGVIIYIVHKPFPDIYKPSGKLFELCSEGRLLIISYPTTLQEKEYIRNNGVPPRGLCEKMNDFALDISSRQFHPLLFQS
ncbi:MAG: hypothetical protein K2I92_03190 [Muribaculaceae bacterium]|nr:hypothetical protein [Muribaculaceae bacterium]